jgi:undecaprenyl diphosphate synthase
MPESVAEPDIIPNHLAVIMDGNGRWAKARGRPRAFGHGRGVEAVRTTVEAAASMGVKYLTLFSFSTENWNRPPDEVGALFALMRRYVEADLKSLHERGVRIRIIGRRDDLDDDLKSIIATAEDMTRGNDSFNLTIAFNYGGRDEIVRAARKIAEASLRGELDPAMIDDTGFAQQLDTHDLPDVDLLVRTSGEQRISNFMLWQAAYAEMVFLDVLWPDFSANHLRGALSEYGNRSRRYGGVDVGAA